MPPEGVAPTEFGRQLYVLSLALRREMDQRVRAFGLTDATWRPLLYLGRLGDGVRQTDLAAALEIEDPSLVRLLDVLERANLLERIEDPDDRRTKRLRMTAAGRETYAQVAAVHADFTAHVLEDVTPADLAVCYRVFGTICRAIGRHGAGMGGR
ncbi:MarR family winged helix-turn-helix transcriptional regulator [Acidisoma cladoniae]|jgi:MarR family transcriptional regulator for hemolysin|uniref:MarR family winged helix-turn-helix transcriptional regulator n=1 Tax=Acidisoma cladoniae TaxID=3040935 RepID=UPI002549FD23|nr:MarR family transcriptional regulator [Acidisoma sp. PAMC 29798]